LTVVAASFVAVVAYCGVPELARRCITARVARTSGLSTAVTVFAILNNAVATFLCADGLDVSVLGETGRPDAVAA